MPVHINFGSVDAALKSAAEDVYNQGFQAGWDAAVAKVLASLDRAPENGRAHESSGPDVIVQNSDGSATIIEVKSRARRGAVDEALEIVLKATPGMTQDQVEAAALAVDPTISAKSVYNKLRYWEGLNRKFRRKNDRWFRIEDLPSDFPVRRDGMLHMPEQKEAPV